MKNSTAEKIKRILDLSAKFFSFALFSSRRKTFYNKFLIIITILYLHGPGISYPIGLNLISLILRTVLNESFITFSYY
jgi:hypothetical protein